VSTSTAFAPVPGGPPVGVLAAPGTDFAPQFDEVDRWCRRRDLDLVALSVSDPAERVDGLQLVIALGGDGTILRALRVAAPHAVPVLGVNFGHVGFLSDVGGGELTQALAAVAAGHARVERRSALHAVVRSGPELDELAYNDVVLGRRAGHGAARIVVTVDGTRIVDVVGDGVVVATGLGSTAYTVSAGGPAVSPLLDPMVLTPVAANTGPLRSLVISIDEGLRLIARDDSAPLTVEIDGQTMEELAPGAALDIGRADDPALLVRTAPVTFYDDLRDRLLTR
jgi:NAD+ kinase